MKSLAFTHFTACYRLKTGVLWFYLDGLLFTVKKSIHFTSSLRRITWHLCRETKAVCSMHIYLCPPKKDFAGHYNIEVFIIETAGINDIVINGLLFLLFLSLGGGFVVGIRCIGLGRACCMSISVLES